MIILNVEYGIANEKDYISSWYSLRLTLTSKFRFTDIERDNLLKVSVAVVDCISHTMGSIGDQPTKK